MKILLVTNMWPNKVKPYFGSYVEHEYQLLILDGHNIDRIVINGHKSGGSSWSYLKAILNLIFYRLNPNKNYDVIYCTHAFCVFLAALCGFKKIVYANHEGEFFVRSAVEDFKLLAYRFCKSARFVNYKMMNQIKFDGPKKFLPAAINPLSISKLSMHEAKEVLGLSQKVNYIFFPGDPLRKEKNFDFVEKFKRTNINHFETEKLDILTGGEIAPEDMGIYYRASFVTMVTSLFESDGLVFRESLCNQRPFISFDVGNASFYSQYGGNIFNTEFQLMEKILRELNTPTETTYQLDDLSHTRYLADLIEILSIDRLNAGA